mmetsp:Transcript_29456/g.68284  ORF Transcript_29456/g.68284 Transcript_29456/m.68284 type:complete len:182 (-) Transcript_29456:194-739(-)|eukprot:CAMPEP_0114540748 /NCGR_PEP_ID=MMETSP0114-20121206/939_1 /TAXON_ID=31324 /ORGANISM="Goniomonas sp, Strain m" /LENGTH=181 /DNA_ID=CAMNT_0001724943 /DNA_START=52 /DNA_END=597 /DNA_ORIENTATION=-
MGLFKKFFEVMGFSKPNCKIIVIGLDNSGKTTIINKLKPKKAQLEETAPTVGFQIESFSKSNISFTCVDMSGAGRYRSLWEHYYKDAQAIVFVIDCSDKLRMCVVKEELDRLLRHPDTGKRPTMFFANKMDISGHLQAVECVQILELDKIKDRPWHITASNALTGEGLEEGVSWISEHVRG